MTFSVRDEVCLYCGWQAELIGQTPQGPEARCEYCHNAIADYGNPERWSGRSSAVCHAAAQAVMHRRYNRARAVDVTAADERFAAVAARLIYKRPPGAPAPVHWVRLPGLGPRLINADGVPPEALWNEVPEGLEDAENSRAAAGLLSEGRSGTADHA